MNHVKKFIERTIWGVARYYQYREGYRVFYGHHDWSSYSVWMVPGTAEGQ